MKRLTLVLAFLTASTLLADDQAGIQQTIEYVRKLQTRSGGLLPSAPKAGEKSAPSLRATSAGLRAVKYLGGKWSDPEGAARFVESCFDASSGGFADTPKGKPDVFTTAVGIMAVAELKMPADKYATGVTRYLCEHAKELEEIRLGAAAMEAAKQTAPCTDAWIKAVRSIQNADGTFGKGLGQARDTGGMAVILLRLGVKLEHPEAVLAALKEGQRSSGGYGKADAENADLETSYRIMRCFVMLKDRPKRVEGLRTFVAKCRNEDGGYGIAPAQPSTVGATYFAAILRHWLAQ